MSIYINIYYFKIITLLI